MKNLNTNPIETTIFDPVVEFKVTTYCENHR